MGSGRHDWRPATRRGEEVARKGGREMDLWNGTFGCRFRMRPGPRE